MRVIRTDRKFIAHALPWGSVVVGRYYARFTPREQAAILMHEKAHIVLGHHRQRLKWALQLRWLWDANFVTLVREHEFEADAWAARHGHAAGVLAYLGRFYEIEPDPLHPSPRERIKRIRQGETHA